MTRIADLIHDWNTQGGTFRPTRPLQFDDETLRDGLQSPSVKTPSIEQKLEILHGLAAIGIDWLVIVGVFALNLVDPDAYTLPVWPQLIVLAVTGGLLALATRIRGRWTGDRYS